MRITNNMMAYNFLHSLNQSKEKQNDLQEKIADGKAIHRPSDDPVRAMRSMRFNVSLDLNDQYTQNLKDATSWMETTDSAMSDMSSLLVRVKELAVSADGSKPADALKSIGDEIDGLINQAVTLANTKIGDRYIFAGQKDNMQPFVRRTVTPAAPALPYDAVVYNGDANKISMQIQPGIATPTQDGVNLTGIDVFGPMTADTDGGAPVEVSSIFDHLIKIKEALTQTPPNNAYVLSTGLQNLDDDHTSILRAQTQLGARMAHYEMAQTMMEMNSTSITGQLSSNEDLDVPKAIIDLKTIESTYNSALSVGSRVLPASLVDFLK